MSNQNIPSDSHESITQSITHSSLIQIQDQATTLFNQALNSQDLYQLKVQYLGKTGALTEAMKLMATLPKEEKPTFGKQVNFVKAHLENLYEQIEKKLKKIEVQKKMQLEKIDLTLSPGGALTGKAHPVARVTEEIFSIMSRIGYALRTGPMIEKDYYNFEALNIPKDHPARDMQDTFFVDDHFVLRTHTSPIQIHSLETETLPLRVIGTGPVFRCDSDISHLPHFHQIEGMCVDQKISMADLKGTISYFVREFFGAGLKTRFRPSFFPFTEPSAEVDCSCPLCKGSGCHLCKQSGWIEIGGCGLINPHVLNQAKVDSKKYQGFAFGFGVERMAIIKYGIDDIRHFPKNDVRFLNQF